MLVVLCSIIFTGQPRNCDVTMSHTLISGVRDNVTEIKAVIFYLFHFFTYHFARFGRFARFVSLVSLVSVVSFRPFRFVVSGFSTCRW